MLQRSASTPLSDAAYLLELERSFSYWVSARRDQRLELGPVLDILLHLGCEIWLTRQLSPRALKLGLPSVRWARVVRHCRPMTTSNASEVSPKIARLERKLAKRQKQLDRTKC